MPTLPLESLFSVASNSRMQPSSVLDMMQAFRNNASRRPIYGFSDTYGTHLGVKFSPFGRSSSDRLGEFLCKDA